MLTSKSTPTAPLKTQMQINTYIWKFKDMRNNIHTSKAVSEEKARNNICFKQYGTDKPQRDIFNSKLELIFCSNPLLNPQYIGRVQRAEYEADVWKTCEELKIGVHINKINVLRKPTELTNKNNIVENNQTSIWNFI